MLRLVSRSLVNKTSSLHGGSLLLYTVSSLCSAATNDDVTIHDLWSICRPWPKLNRMTKSRACQIFKIKKLDEAVIDKYSVKFAPSLKFFNENTQETISCVSVVYPWYNLSNDIQYLNCEAISSDTDHMTSLLTTPTNFNGIFGWNLIPVVNDSMELIITDNELDAITAHQCTSIPTVAMTTNVLNDLSFTEVIEQLEKFDKIYYWPRQGSKSTPPIFELLSKPKCHLVINENCGKQFNGPLDALNKSYNIKDILSKSKLFLSNDKAVITIHQLKKLMYIEFLNHDKVEGVKWKRFPELTKHLKGFRVGEMTIIIGPTGAGKTTLMCELSLDICQQNVPTLWGSFELSNVRLGKILFRQFAGQNFEDKLNEFNYWMEKFQNIPLRFMDFHGQTEIDDVIKVMSRSVTKYGIQHVIIDNLQFMIGSASSYRGFDDSLYAQNRAIAKFRYFATTHKVHLTIVMHPRKENDEKLLTTSSIYGTAKAAQEADNVLILQVPSPKDKFLQVTKNRFSGDLGKVPLRFDRESLTFSGVFSNAVPQQRGKHEKQIVSSKKYSKSSTGVKYKSLKSSNLVTNGILKPPLLIKPLGKLN